MARSKPGGGGGARKSSSGRQRARNGPRAGRGRSPQPPSVEDIADLLVRGGAELLEVEDPLEAEAWASGMLGMFYKIDAPWEAREELDRNLWPAIVAKAEGAGGSAGRAVLEALAAVTEDPLAASAGAAAARLGSRGVAAPGWAGELGSLEFQRAWVLTDVYGDQEAYYAVFRYPGRPPHIVNALYDRAVGDIIKDAFVGYVKGTPEAVLVEASRDPGMSVTEADPGAMARRILDAIHAGDMFLDNAWTREFKQFRALVLARMRSLPPAPPPPDRVPLDAAARDTLLGEFLASRATTAADADIIASHCLDYSCDYLGDDGLRWSPIVVEQFLMDYLPRKVSLALDEVGQVPEVLRAWVRFTLEKRGLAERWIVETQAAVDQYAKDFRAAMTDQQHFGPAKTIVHAMLADGIDVSDEAAVTRWVEAFNKRSLAEREALLGD